jgi:hypothetical protein
MSTAPQNSPKRQIYPTLPQHHLYAHRKKRKHAAAGSWKILCTLYAQTAYGRANACIKWGTVLLQGEIKACSLQNHTTSVIKGPRLQGQLTAC